VPAVSFRVPRMLEPYCGGRTFEVEADTVRAALDAAMRLHPLLRTHLEDEEGRLRPHVNVFHNDTEVRRLPSLEEPVREGDQIVVLQAISGG